MCSVIVCESQCVIHLNDVILKSDMLGAVKPVLCPHTYLPFNLVCRIVVLSWLRAAVVRSTCVSLRSYLGSLTNHRHSGSSEKQEFWEDGG